MGTRFPTGESIPIPTMARRCPIFSPSDPVKIQCSSAITEGEETPLVPRTLNALPIGHRWDRELHVRAQRGSEG